MARCGFCFANVMCACSNTSGHRVALLSPSASEPVVVSFASLPDQFHSRLSTFQTRASFEELRYFSKRPTFLPVAGLLSFRIRPDCKTLLPDYLLSNTPPPPHPPTEVHRLQGVASLVDAFWFELEGE